MAHVIIYSKQCIKCNTIAHTGSDLPHLAFHLFTSLKSKQLEFKDQPLPPEKQRGVHPARSVARGRDAVRLRRGPPHRAAEWGLLLGEVFHVWSPVWLP